MPPRNAMPGTDGFDFGSSLVWTLEFLAWQRTEILAEFRWAAWGWWDDAPAGPQDHPPVKLHKASFYEMIRGDFLGSAHLLSLYFKGDSFGCIMFFCLGGEFYFLKPGTHCYFWIWLYGSLTLLISRFHLLFITKEAFFWDGLNGHTQCWRGIMWAHCPKKIYSHQDLCGLEVAFL